MKSEDLRPIRCQCCGKLICEANGTVAFRCPRCKAWWVMVSNVAGQSSSGSAMRPR